MREVRMNFLEKIEAPLLFWFAGVDRRLLVGCDDAEKYKFTFTGLLVFIITLLTLISSFYGLTDYLLPEDSRHDLVWFLYFLLSIFLSLGWSAIVFNLFRFFVTSVPTTDQTGLSTAGEFASLIVQLFFCLVFAVVLGFPIAILMLDSQISFEGKELQRATLKDVSMTVNYIDSHENTLHTKLDAAYRKLEMLKLDEKSLQVQLAISKRSADLSVEAQAEIRENQLKQETELAQIQKIRQTIDDNFHALLEKNNAMHLVGKSRFIWQHNLPVTLFIILFIFIVYASLIFSKFVLVRGKYEYLMNYENRIPAFRSGIIEEKNPMIISNKLVRFYRFGKPEAIQTAELKWTAEMKRQLDDDLRIRLKRETDIASNVLDRLRSR